MEIRLCHCRIRQTKTKLLQRMAGLSTKRVCETDNAEEHIARQECPLAEGKLRVFALMCMRYESFGEGKLWVFVLMCMR